MLDSAIVTMFPFLPRKPMLGGKLVKKRKAEAEAAAAAAATAAAALADSEAKNAGTPASTARANGTSDTDKKRRAKAPTPKKPSPLDDLREGGPVERAIRSDLGNLRKLFDEDCRRRGSSMVDASASTGPHGTVEDDILHHDRPGSWYLLFKSAYRRGKFGIMHTRCMPNRIDRAEFAQIIYAACLGLFEESMDRIDIDVGDQSPNSNLMTDAAFALFALYTLYDTCPLPDFPSIVQTSNAMEGTKSAGGVFSKQETDVLTTLPLGLTAAGEQSRVIYRQAYKSPIRIGHAEYARILELQELCLERKSKCECRRAEYVVKAASDGMINDCSIEDENISSSPAKTDRWICQCGIADDCLEIIHRLHSKDCFDFCEYSGPCSVEGLVGSAKYFDKVVEPSNKKAKDDVVASLGATSNLLREGHGAALPIDAATSATALGIDGFGKLYSNYHAALNKVHSIHTSNGNQSNQARQIEETLRPVLRRRRRWSARNGGDNVAKANSTVRLGEILDKVQSGKVSAGDTLGLLEFSDDDEMGDAEPARRSIWDQAGTAAGDEPLPIAAEQDDREARSKRPQVRFKLPDKISQSLQRSIQDVLASVDADLDMSTGQQFHPKEGVPITIGGGDAQTYMSMGMFDLEDIDLEPSNNEGADHDVESVITQHTGHSVIPTTGAADALRDLLAFAKDDSDNEAAGDGDDDDDNDNDGDREDVGVVDAKVPVQKEKTKGKPSRKRTRKQRETPDDDISMVSAPSTAGGGMNALGSLLSKVKSVPEKTKPISKTKTKRTPKTQSRRQQHTSNDEEDEVSMVSAPLASGGGGNALGDLLSMATHHDKDDVSMVSAPLASGGGGNALGDLLSRAKKDEPEVEDSESQ